MSINSIPGMTNAYQKTAGLTPEKPNLNDQSVRNDQAQSAEKSSERTDYAQNAQLTIRQQTQAGIVEMMFSTSESANQNALKITYQEAIDEINNILTAQLGDQADPSSPLPISQKALDAQGGMDYWTPENTANRIVEGATAFLAGYQKAHPELEGEALMNSFMEVVGGGISQGFDQAKGVLGDLKVLKEGDIESNIDLTFKLVQSGLDSFKNQYLGIKSSEPETILDEPLTQNKAD